MWIPKLNIKKLSSLPVGIFSSGFFLDGRIDSRWVAIKNEDESWTVKFVHVPFHSNWYAENEGAEWDEWKKAEEEKIALTGTTMKLITRVSRLIECDKQVLDKYKA